MKYWVQINENNIVTATGQAASVPASQACLEITLEQYQTEWLLGSLYQNGEFIEQPKEQETTL